MHNIKKRNEIKERLNSSSMVNVKNVINEFLRDRTLAPLRCPMDDNVTKVRDFIRVLLDCFLNVLELAERVDIFKDRVG